MIIVGDCREVMRTLDEASVDAIVCDPPYGLSFMGKDWDHGVPGVAFWTEALRVLKPGGYLLAFGGTRTFHRMTCAIEDAGFEIRDCLSWLYGSGFPKSLDVSKAIDKMAGAEREVVGPNAWHARGGLTRGSTYGEPSRPSETAPATPEAERWAGWGTALKPAWEPIIVARKPLEGTVAANVVQHGTGALNIDGCRIASDGEHMRPYQPTNNERNVYAAQSGFHPTNAEGRWPANVVLDEAAAMALDQMSGERKSSGGAAFDRAGYGGGWTPPNDASREIGYGDTGGASRFMYVAKASRSERNAGLDGMPVRETGELTGRKPGSVGLVGNPENRGQTGNPYASSTGAPRANHHPTVKPIALMRWLVRLVTPPGGLVCESCYNKQYEHSTTPTSSATSVRDMRHDIQTEGQHETGQVLLEAVRESSANQVGIEDVRVVRSGVPAGSSVTSGAVLQQALCDQITGSQTGQGLRNGPEGIQTAVSTGSSDGLETGLRDGAPRRNGRPSGAQPEAFGSGASPQRGQGRQPDREPAIDGEAGARSDPQATAQADLLSSLWRQNPIVGTCPTCGGNLRRKPAVVLDPFCGSGSTGAACALEGFDFLGIEQDAEYAAIAEKRIAYWQANGDRPLKGEMRGGANATVSYGKIRKRRCNVCGNQTNSAWRGGRYPNCDHDDWSWVNQEPKPRPVAIQPELDLAGAAD